MTPSHIVNRRTRQYVWLRCTKTFLRRLRGLRFTRKLSEDEGFLLSPCNSIHMIGMRYALDIVYIDQSWRIIKIVPNLSVFFGVSFCRDAAVALGLKAGSIEKFGWQIGDQLVFFETIFKDE